MTVAPRFLRPASGGRPLTVPGLVTLLLLLALPLTAPGQVTGSGSSGTASQAVDPEVAPRPVGTAVPATGPLTIDGRLDEPAWQTALPLTGFIQAIPDAGRPATEETEVRMLYDDRHLFIGAFMHDTRPDLLVSGTLERDHPGVSAHDIDLFGVFLDTFLDRRNGYLFLVNPAGAVRDGQAFDNSRNLDFAWDAVVEVATQIHDDGWTVEMAIPWTTLRFDPSRDEQLWGVNFHRSIARRNERTAWAPLDRRHQIHFAERAGTVEGPADVPVGRNIRLKPFVLSQDGRGATLPDWRRGTQADGGLDLKWGLTPRMTMDLTWRADFSHVEVDREQVNLSRFPAFFPERREFFVENSGMFLFGEQSERNYRGGTSGADLRLFHSRRIGLEGGRPVPLLGGGRLSGQVGDTEVGILHARTGAVDEVSGDAFSVVRLRRRVGAASDVGVLVTDRQGRGGSGWNRAGGLDMNLRLGPSLLISSYAATTSRSGASDEDDWTGRLWVAWRDQLWDVSALARRVGEDFDPGIGFVQRRGMTHLYGTVGAHPRPGIPGVLDLNPYLEAHRYTSVAGEVETTRETGGLGVNFADGGDFSTRVTRRMERLESGFQVEGQGLVPAGTYRFTEAEARYQSSGNRQISGNVVGAIGGYFGGRRQSIGAGLRWQPDPRISLAVQADRNAIELGDDRFSANLYRTELRVARSTRLYLGSVVQYNEAQELLVSNLRLTWLHAPLSEAYLVFTDRRRTGNEASASERLVTLKVTRLLAF